MAYEDRNSRIADEDRILSLLIKTGTPSSLMKKGT